MEVTKILISVRLVTDGDFSLPNFKEIGFVYNEVSGSYTLRKDFTHEEAIECIIAARSVLQETLCSIYVSPTHYWLIDDLFHLFEGAICFIEEDKSGNYYEDLSGNYDGTYIDVSLIC